MLPQALKRLTSLARTRATTSILQRPFHPFQPKCFALATKQQRNYSYASKWHHVSEGPIDPILGIQEQFINDPNPEKISLVVGAYRTDEGKPWVLPSVHEAEIKVLEDANYNHEYGPIAGNKNLCELSKMLMFGEKAKHLDSICTMQALSGTGALRVIAGFIKEHWGNDTLPTVHCPNPTWANHHQIFNHAGIQTKSYPYYYPKTKGLDFPGMMSYFENLGANDVVILHAVAHNPTGVDPSHEQWKEICHVLEQEKVTVLFDSAYQGFASGDFDRDSFAVRHFREKNVPMMVAQSFAKNFGLYGHRVGAVHFLCKDVDEALRVESQAKIVARAMYSNPPLHGAKIVAKILGDLHLKQQWIADVKTMSSRIMSMREELHRELAAAGSPHSWRHITDQIGMFCFTGLRPEQVDRLRAEFSVYLTRNGRISVAGLNSGNVARIAHAFHEVTKDDKPDNED